jgi:hypothetical protein
MQSKGLWLALGYKMTKDNAMHNRESAQQVYPDRNPMRSFAPTTINQLASMRTFAPTTINQLALMRTFAPTTINQLASMRTFAPTTNNQLAPTGPSACTNSLHICAHDNQSTTINQHVHNHFGSIVFLLLPSRSPKFGLKETSA